MSQAHKQAGNKYLTSRPMNEIMYSNETFTAYRSAINSVYKLPNGDIVIKKPTMLKAGLLGKGGQDFIGMDQTVITEDHIGLTIPWFKTAELKLPGDRLKPEQIQWYKIMKTLGAKADVLLYKNGVYSPIDVDKQGTRVIK